MAVVVAVMVAVRDGETVGVVVSVGEEVGVQLDVAELEGDPVTALLGDRVDADVPVKVMLGVRVGNSVCEAESVPEGVSADDVVSNDVRVGVSVGTGVCVCVRVLVPVADGSGVQVGDTVHEHVQVDVPELDAVLLVLNADAAVSGHALFACVPDRASPWKGLLC